MSNAPTGVTPNLLPGSEYKAANPQKAWGRFEVAMHQILKSPKGTAHVAEEIPAANIKDDINNTGKA